MDDTTFNALVKKRIEKNLATLASKGKGYGREDRLHQFKEVGMRKHESPEMALHGMAEKHNLSVFDGIHDIELDEYDYINQKWIDDKIGDAINYLILLEALISERLIQNKLEKSTDKLMPDEQKIKATP